MHIESSRRLSRLSRLKYVSELVPGAIVLCVVIKAVVVWREEEADCWSRCEYFSPIVWRVVCLLWAGIDTLTAIDSDANSFDHLKEREEERTRSVPSCWVVCHRLVIDFSITRTLTHVMTILEGQHSPPSSL
jgi:hypothetical protein